MLRLDISRSKSITLERGLIDRDKPTKLLFLDRRVSDPIRLRHEFAYIPNFHRLRVELRHGVLLVENAVAEVPETCFGFVDLGAEMGGCLEGLEGLEVVGRIHLDGGWDGVVVAG